VLAGFVRAKQLPGAPQWTASIRATARRSARHRRTSVSACRRHRLARYITGARGQLLHGTTAHIFVLSTLNLLISCQFCKLQEDRDVTVRELIKHQSFAVNYSSVVCLFSVFVSFRQPFYLRSRSLRSYATCVLPLQVISSKDAWLPGQPSVIIPRPQLTADAVAGDGYGLPSSSSPRMDRDHQPSRPGLAARRSPYQPAVGAPLSYRYNAAAAGGPPVTSYRI